MEEIIFTLISFGGEARSFAMEAIYHAKENNFEEAELALENAKDRLEKAHVEQTKLIQGEASGNKTEMTLLMVHAQDHLMNAITVKDLAKEMVDMYKRVGGN